MLCFDSVQNKQSTNCPYRNRAHLKYCLILHSNHNHYSLVVMLVKYINCCLIYCVHLYHGPCSSPRCATMLQWVIFSFKTINTDTPVLRSSNRLHILSPGAGLQLISVPNNLSCNYYRPLLSSILITTGSHCDTLVIYILGCNNECGSVTHGRYTSVKVLKDKLMHLLLMKFNYCNKNVEYCYAHSYKHRTEPILHKP